jgi:23S rRNA (uracil1939-C5)-methyltransferase
VHVEKWIYGGDALSRVDGRVVLTPFVLPGETARVEVEAERSGLVRTRLLEVISPSPDRQPPPCPYFGECGGCHYQHGRYEFQVEQKAAIVREQLRRVGHIEYGGDIGTITGPPLGYRNRSQIHVKSGRIGYFADGTHRLVPIDHCPISSPKINDALAALVRMLGDRRFPEFINVVELFTDEAKVLLNVLDSARPVARRFFDWAGQEIPDLARGSIDYAVGSDLFQVSHNSFFQVNRFLLGDLVEAGVGHAAGAVALDLYSGVGLFSLQIARRFRSVTAVESAASAIHDLNTNAGRAGLSIRTVHSSVERFLPQVLEQPDLVLADPPRAGLGKKVTAELLRLRPARIHIIACDPSTLARDLSALVRGGYGIEKLIMVDLFPQTYHVETVAHLVRA